MLVLASVRGPAALNTKSRKKYPAVPTMITRATGSHPENRIDDTALKLRTCRGKRAPGRALPLEPPS